MGLAMDDFMTEKEVAEFLMVSQRTIQEMRYANRAPPYIQVGARTIRYLRSEFLAWLEKRTVQPKTKEAKRA